MTANIEYMLASKLFFEPAHLGRLSDRTFQDVVKQETDGGWEICRQGVWTMCRRPGKDLPWQGWKIHLSTVPNQAAELLQVAVRHFVRCGTSFKFLSDKRMLRVSHSKPWPRGSSGKFITAYPAGAEEFKRLLDELHQATADRFDGPYVLSDRRYKDSKVLYYRYGGMRPNVRLGVDGRPIPVLVAPDGREVPDARKPFFALPEWQADVFPDDTPPGAGGLKLQGRYVVKKAIHFSNSGGVYLAHDDVLGGDVVLKEARAHVHHAGDGWDARQVLRHECSILGRIRDCGIAPRPVEVFDAWEHAFLAEEYLEGYISLTAYTAQNSLLFETRPTPEKVREHLRNLLTILSGLASALVTLHGRGVVFGDLSPGNVLVDPATLDVKLIDFEGARVVGSFDAPSLFTPGFADPKQVAGATPDFADDSYGLGMVMLHLMTHLNGMLEIKPGVADAALAEVIKDFGLPGELKRIFADLTAAEPVRRVAPQCLLFRQGSACLEAVGEVGYVKERSLAEGSARVAALVRECCRFVKAAGAHERSDRLLPADPEVFETNPLSLAYGALGVVYALNKIEGKADRAMLDWVGRQPVTNRKYAPGWATGMAGLAWAMLEVGEVDKAEWLLRQSLGHPLLPASASLYHGAAGWGMANLRFWLATGKGIYVEQALAAAESILGTAKDGDGGLCWPDPDGRVPLGLAHGATGVGLFFLFLFAATGRSRLKELAVRALDHDLSRAVEWGGNGLTWPRWSDAVHVVYPYWEYGSAGVGIACLRFLKVLRDPRYQDLIERIFIDCDRKYAVYPGRKIGLAGIGEFLLDAFQFTNDERFRSSALRLAEGVEVFAIRRDDGVAFPGHGPRISCDFATGTAGIMLTLDRLVTGRRGDFLPDDILQGVS